MAGYSKWHTHKRAAELRTYLDTTAMARCYRPPDKPSLTSGTYSHEPASSSSVFSARV